MRRPPTQEEEEHGSTARAKDDDGEWRCGSYRYANAQFYSTLRSWEGKRDVAETTPADWRVSTADTLHMGGRDAYDISLIDHVSHIWTEHAFRGGLRDYPGQDVAYDAKGNPRAQPKDSKSIAGTNLGSIYRSTKQCNVLTTARADETFAGSLRSAPPKSAAEYQRTRRTHLNMPQYSELSPAEASKAKRLFAQIDVDGSGMIDTEQLIHFLSTLGHQPKSKAVKQLVAAAEAGADDTKLKIQEFARIYHGLAL